MTYNNIEIYENISTLKDSSVPPTDCEKLIFVKSRNAWFTWESDSTLLQNDLDVVQLTASSVGRYLRKLETHLVHQLMPVWNIDPINGNDDNDGFYNPLKTCRELQLRLSGKISISTTINVLNDLLSSDPLTLTCNSSVDYINNSSNSTIILNIVGTKKLVRSGTISYVTQPDSSNNTCGSITDTNANWTDSITNNNIIVMTSGVSNTKILWPIKNMGSGEVRVNYPVNQTNGTVSNFPSVNDTYNEYSLTKGLIYLSTDVATKISNWYQPTLSSVGFIVSKQQVSFYGCSYGNIQAIFCPGLNLNACRDSNVSATQQILQTKIKIYGCSLLKSNVLLRSYISCDIKDCILQGVKIINDGNGTTSSGYLSISNTCIVDVTNGTNDAHAIEAGSGSVCRLGANVWGSNNNICLFINNGGKVIVDKNVVPTITGNREIMIDESSNFFTQLELSSGSTLPMTLECKTWNQWVDSFSRNVISYKKLSSLCSN